MGKLVLFRPDGMAQDVRLDRERVTIGRRADNDVCLPQAAVSGEHAAVVTILDDSFLEDLGSTNGTLVNGKPVTKHFLRDRDEIDIGREILIYLTDESAVPAAPPRRPARPAASARGSAAPEPAGAGRQGAAGVPRDKRRSDALMAISGDAVDAIQRFVAAEIEGNAAEPAGPASGAAETPPVPAIHAERPAPSVRVLSGSGAGRVLPLAGSETLIGRAGVQVVALRRADDEVRVVPVEGTTPPRINGVPVPADGQRLVAGDILEVVGATLDLVAPSDGAA
jgi:predicted component of type VI protein secretion system